MIIYDVRGERSEGVPHSTEIINIRTMGGAKAVAQRLQREGYVVQISSSATQTRAETVNPFSGKRPDGRTARARRSRLAIETATRALMISGQWRPTAKEIAQRADMSVRTVFDHYGGVDVVWIEAIKDHATKMAIIRAICGDWDYPTQGLCDRIVQAVVLGRTL